MAGSCRLQPSSAGGFVYLWLLLSLTALQLGVAGATLSTRLAAQRAQERELLFIGRQFVAAIGSYHAWSSQPGLARYPASLDELLRDPRAAGIRRHLRRIYVDPVTGRAEWGLVKQGGRIIGVHSLSARRPLKQAGFGGLLEDGARESYLEWQFIYQPPASS